MNPINNRLFLPFTFPKGITVRNKVAMAPMTAWASNEEYTISDDEVKHYNTRVRGIGLVIMPPLPFFRYIMPETKLFPSWSLVATW
ncbi:NADH:flavin oxidoreductase / NADH oxidase family protein [Chitinophaga sp. CF118]|uniref:hypothetical protein n=1 Tax=Chitinophaga sp. CF118 TaxID=1884367 RepID=UPI0008E8E7D4|nr:hypothetical protein [Chitinophaga sp. CF118]SFD08773.1 NADH:flavin oxidoreductase / NADH oxidase family protein [Chitinophaga sp. CF118]